MAPKRKHSPSRVKFARGFKKADEATRRKALKDKHSNDERIPLIYDWSISNLFQDIPKPQDENDWLAQYAEAGQSVALFEEENPWISGRKVSKYRGEFIPSGENLVKRYPDGRIYLVEFVVSGSTQPRPDVDALAEFTRVYLGLPVNILEPLELVEKLGGLKLQSQSKYVEFRKHGDKIQLRCCSLLSMLVAMLPSSAIALVGLTSVDLYEDESDLFVAGLARGNKRVAVFSFARYNPLLKFCPEFWYKQWTISQPKSKKKAKRNTNLDISKIILERSKKLIVHEVCHLLGFDHCIYFSCIMNGSGHLEEDFRQPMFLCPICLKKLNLLVGEDAVHRYERLLNYAQAENLPELAAWYSQRLNQLNRNDYK